MKILLLNTFLFLFFKDANAQDILVTFRQQVITISALDSNRNFIYKWVDAENQNTEFKLFINKDRSLFKIIDNENESHVAKAHLHYYDFNSFYSDKTSGYLFQSAEALTNQPVIIKDSLNAIHWYFTKEEAIICGFDCRKAIGVVGGGYVYAWYAYDLPKQYGPFSYTGLPGTVLLIEFSEAEVRYIAKSVTEEEHPIVIPDSRQILRSDYEAILKEKRSYRGGFFGKKLDPYEVPHPLIFKKY